MIVVAGEVRSGTSMWMQALRAGGLSVIGEPQGFDWLPECNPRGYWEHEWRCGVPASAQPRPGTALKQFAPGFMATAPMHHEAVIVTMRPWREWCRSIDMFTRWQVVSMARKLGRVITTDDVHRDPNARTAPDAHEWLADYAMIAQHLHRHEIPHVVAWMPDVIASPRPTMERVGDMLAEVGVPFDVNGASGAVEPSLRHHEDEADDFGADAETIAVCDAVCDHARRGVLPADLGVTLAGILTRTAA